MAFRKFIPVSVTRLERDEYLRRVGLGKKIGNGSYAEVFAHPTKPDRVYKVTKPHSFDRAYLAYVHSLLRLRKPAPYLPRIYNVGIVVSLHTYSELIKDTWYAARRRVARGHARFLIVEMERLVYDYENTDGGQILAEKLRSYADNVFSAPKPLRLGVALLNTLFRKGHCPDLHGANILKRPITGDWVLTDPVC